MQGHVYLARVGVGGVTATTAPALMTGEAPNQVVNPLFLKLGEALTGTLGVEAETKEIVRIVQGQRETEELTLNEKFTAKITIQELNKLVVDMIFGSDTTATDDFIARGSNGRKAWVFQQAMDHGNAARVLLLGLATVRPAGDVPLFGEDVFKADFEMKFIGRPTGKLLGAYPA